MKPLTNPLKSAQIKYERPYLVLKTTKNSLKSTMKDQFFCRKPLQAMQIHYRPLKKTGPFYLRTFLKRPVSLLLRKKKIKLPKKDHKILSQKPSLSSILRRTPRALKVFSPAQAALLDGQTSRLHPLRPSVLGWGEAKWRTPFEFLGCFFFFLNPGLLFPFFCF